MNPKTVIKGKIHYVGVNDRNKHLFEGMWPLPYGVSYNSYLIDDETVALVDTVDICYFEVYLRKIKSIIGERPIQYLIINHMEPDHSGSIRLIKQHYPDIIIVGNKQTFGMIEGFYGVTGEQYMVKDEDFLALGHHKLRFYMTPMVHWPETMMTFDETEGVLFAGDGFGCFGTLDGGFLDTRINLDRYWDEMVRYYSNIVGKYGSPVQKALAKLGGLPISTICSTHGPVWTENIAKVIGIYDKLSRYAADEGVVIAYGSMYGNTENAAQALAASLCDKGMSKVAMYDVSSTHVSQLISEAFKYSHIVLASVTYNLGIYPAMHDFLMDMKALNLQNRTFAIIENGSWAVKSGDLMQKFVNDELKNMTVLNERLSLASSMGTDKRTELEALADAILESMK
jgi:flavorubredoxin